jgi:hypothetical protein
MALFTAGDIVLADWRGDALPKKPNKRRPAPRAALLVARSAQAEVTCLWQCPGCY